MTPSQDAFIKDNELLSHRKYYGNLCRLKIEVLWQCMFPENGKGKLLYDLKILIYQEIPFRFIIGRHWKQHYYQDFKKS